DDLVDQCHAFGELSDPYQAFNERELELRVAHLVPHRAELLQTRLKALNPAPCVTLADGHGTFIAASNGKIGSERMGCGERGTDRGQGSGPPADPGAGRRGPAYGHPLPAASRQDHADARPDRDDRERLCPLARGGGVARRTPP